MKAFITPTYTFTPGASGVGTIDLSNIPSFDIKRLAAIINQTSGTIIYSTASASKKYTDVTDGVVTLFFDTSSMDAGDTLQIVYETDLAVATEDKQDDLLANLILLLGSIGDDSDAAQNDYLGSGSVIALLKGILEIVEGNGASIQETNSLLIGNTPEYFEDLTISDSEENTSPTGLPRWTKIMADPNNTSNLRVKFGGTASPTSGFVLEPGRSEDFNLAGPLSYCSEQAGANKMYVLFGI